MAQFFFKKKKCSNESKDTLQCGETPCICNSRVFIPDFLTHKDVSMPTRTTFLDKFNTPQNLIVSELITVMHYIAVRFHNCFFWLHDSWVLREGQHRTLRTVVDGLWRRSTVDQSINGVFLPTPCNTFTQTLLTQVPALLGVLSTNDVIVFLRGSTFCPTTAICFFFRSEGVETARVAAVRIAELECQIVAVERHAAEGRVSDLFSLHFRSVLVLRLGLERVFLVLFSTLRSVATGLVNWVQGKRDDLQQSTRHFPT